MIEMAYKKPIQRNEKQWKDIEKSCKFDLPVEAHLAHYLVQDFSPKKKVGRAVLENKEMIPHGY